MPTRHTDLFASYVEELRRAKTNAEAWWRRLVDAESEAFGNRQAALRSIEARWPTGPVAHPRVIAVFRKYWLACEALNREILELEGFPEDRRAEDTPHVLTPDLDERDESGDTEEGEGEVYPHVFVDEWLIGGDDEDLADFIADLTYSPIGRDENNNYA